jgi:hypothetical protein
MILATGAVQTWMGTSLVLETSLTAITWAVQPLPFQIWSVGCLIVDALILLRECVLRPGGRQQATYVQPTYNMGLLM